MNMAQSTIRLVSGNVALCKPMESLYVPIVVGGRVCNAMLDSGSTVSLIDQDFLNRRSEVLLNSAKQLLLTASGNRMDSIGEVDLPIKIGKFCCYQRFVVVSSLIESCILGVDFLVLHRVALDFSYKRVTGPELGVVNANNNLESSTILCHNHGKPEHYPEMYANVISDGGDAPDEDWKCHGAVPDYIRPLTIDLPECDPEFLDIVEIYKDLFSSIPGVAKVKEFRIRTANSNPVKVPPRLIPQAYYQEVQSQVKEICERYIIRISNSTWLAPPVMVEKKDGTVRGGASS